MGEVTAAIYARVSTEQQTRGNTVASQLALLKDRAETDKVRLEPDHAFVDEGYSGSTLVRPALERLRDAVADSRIDRVYILAPDRLARRYAYQVLLVEEFDAAALRSCSSIGLSGPQRRTICFFRSRA
jgi:site-specific DNA recombinase